jgi:bifunctional non-homologous end joining protein LigD
MLRLNEFGPMRCRQRSAEAFTDPEWLYEIRIDGFRTLASLGRRGVGLRSADGEDCTGFYPELVDALMHIPGEHVMDGVVCALDEVGRNARHQLEARVTQSAAKGMAATGQLTFMVFDLPVHAGKDLVDWPLVRRKSLLRRLLRDVSRPGVLFVDHFPADARVAQKLFVRLGLNGLIAKRRNSSYQPGIQSGDWLKIVRTVT